MFACTRDPCSLIGAVIVLLVPAVLAVQQYRATFRYNSRAAFASSVLLFIVAGFAFVAFATTLGEAIIEDARIPWMPLLLPMVAIGAIAATSAWMNLSWSRRLQRSATEGQGTVDLARFSVRELLIAVAATACITALATHFVRSTSPQYAENVPRDKAPCRLPAQARMPLR